MKINHILMTVALLLLAGSCSETKKKDSPQAIGTGTAIKGDSTLYGLACDGCTDSVLVFLPGQGGDPVVYNIIDAMKRGHVAGRPKLGDWVCLTLAKNDRHKADVVINLDELKGTWVQKVMPKKKNKGRSIDRDKEVRAMEDSILKSKLVPVEIGFSLKRYYTAEPIGLQRPANLESEESPVVYPMPKFYAEWHIFNGKLVLKENGIAETGARKMVKRTYMNDTVDIVMLTKDSLRLRFKDGSVEGYYRK